MQMIRKTNLKTAQTREESELDHSAAETSKRKNFTFEKKVEDKIRSCLVMNVSITNIRKHFLENSFATLGPEERPIL